MGTIVINAFAKINLSIDVLAKRPDGYHEVSMIMQQIDLSDRVRISWEPFKAGEQPRIQLTTSLPFLPADERNIAYQAARLMADRYGKQQGEMKIHIDKRIPVAAGLAGGSADGAAVLHGLSKLWELNLPLKELMKLGAKLGADVPFCVMGQRVLNPILGGTPEQEAETKETEEEAMACTCALATGIGEKLRAIPGLSCWVLLTKPPINVPTGKVYGELRLDEINQRPDTIELIEGLKEKNYHKILKNMINVLENVSLKEYPIIVYTKNKMKEVDRGSHPLMSGSGPTVFSLYRNKKKAMMAYNRLKSLNNETFLVKCLS